MSLYKYCFVAILLLSQLAGCRKYVEEVPVQGQRVLVYTEDYRMLMNNTDQQEIAYGQAPILSCDDADLSAPEIYNNITNGSVQANIYTWQKPFYVDLANR